MAYYVSIILQACLVFPLIAFVFSLPYILYSYHKYGSFLSMRIAIVYSFILYMVCAYFLVILPLPPIDEVAKLTQPSMQLQPFRFISDILASTHFSLQDVSTYLPTLNSASVYQVLFNFALTMPFGMYLRYYFKCSFKKTLLCSLLLALFFELTQLSGLYGIYPRSYRLFDVDDLMINTIGGILGYALMQPFMKVLPSRDEIDAASYRRGKDVSLPRRMTSFVLDSTLIFIASTLLRMLFPIFPIAIAYPFVYLYPLYFTLCCVFNKGVTLGKYITKTKVESTSGKAIRYYQYIIRYGILYTLLAIIPSILYQLLLTQYNLNKMDLNVFFLLSALIAIAIIIYLGFAMIEIATNKNLFYERLSKTKIISTIEVEEKQEDGSEKEAPKSGEDDTHEQTDTVL